MHYNNGYHTLSIFYVPKAELNVVNFVTWFKLLNNHELHGLSQSYKWGKWSLEGLSDSRPIFKSKLKFMPLFTTDPLFEWLAVWAM